MVDISRGWRTSLALCLWLGSSAAWVGCGPDDDGIEDELGSLSEAASAATCRRLQASCDNGSARSCRYLSRGRCDAFLAPAPNPDPGPDATGQCTDSDGGETTSVRGTVTDASGMKYTDECVDEPGLFDHYVREHYCSPRGGHRASSINCVYGCEQGRCRSEKYCTDTDGGNVPSVRGMVVDAWGNTFTDDCLESGAHAGYLRENYCSSSPGGGRNMISLKCEHGCSQGRCLPAPTACTDSGDCASSNPPDPDPGPDATGQCTDTDGGQTTSVRGTVTQADGKTFTDDCIESGPYAGYVREHYCGLGGFNLIVHIMRSIKCEHGCEQGRCRPAPTAGACTPGASKECNSGFSGICSAGKQTCSSSEAWGGCSPLIQKGTVPEICNNEEDDDCDGATDGSDSDCVVSCPAGSYNQGGKCVCAANYATVGSACKPVIEIHRFRSASWADYLFTDSPGEVSSSGGNYTAESGGNFKVFQRNEGGMRALRRCSASVGGGRDHFLSTSSNCEGPVGQSDGGVLGYIDSPLSGGQCAAHRKPLYRCFSLTHHMHLTTTRASECVVAADPANRPADKLVLEGMLGCVPTD